LIIGVITLIVAITTPETRMILGLDKINDKEDRLAIKSNYSRKCGPDNPYVVVNDLFDPNTPNTSNNKQKSYPNLLPATRTSYDNNHFALGEGAEILIQNNTINEVDIIIPNTITTSVSFLGDSPPSADIIYQGFTACAGGGYTAQFSPVKLTNNGYDHLQNTTSNDATFYYIGSGEGLGFYIPFICEDPGIYKIAYILSYSHGNSTELIQHNMEQFLLCPKSFDVYIEKLSDTKKGVKYALIGRYFWDGNTYLVLYDGNYR
jgi:hypothetical protein